MEKDTKLRKFIATTIREFLNEDVGEYSNKLDYGYKFDKSKTI